MISLSTLCQAWPSFRCVLRATSVAAREQALPLGPSACGGLPRSGRAGRSRYNYILQPRGIFADFPMSPPPASAASCARARRPTRRRRALSPAPLARTRNSLCCLHIFNTISLAVGGRAAGGRIFGSSQGNALAKAPCPIIKISR